jgi:hypothetical protein
LLNGIPEFARIGLGICYDVRFPEMAMIAARKGLCPVHDALEILPMVGPFQDVTPLFILGPST